jgi:hypothetical protein
VIVEQDGKSRVTGTKKEIVFSEKENVLELFKDHITHVERTHSGVAAIVV